MYAWHPPRALSAASAVAIVTALAAALIFGLNIQGTAERVAALVSVELSRPRAAELPKPPPRPRTAKSAPTHEAAPQNRRSKATAVVAPRVTPLIKPPPVVTASKANNGAAPSNGASSLPGSGQGAGGLGNGLGGGGSGGDGDGESIIGPHRTGGKLTYQDLPDGVLAPGQEATVDVVFLVTPDGHATNCRAEQSSGHPAIDGLTCRLIEQRFRFRPAEDSYGRPVRAWVEETHTWDAYDPRAR